MICYVSRPTNKKAKSKNKKKPKKKSHTNRMPPIRTGSRSHSKLPDKKETKLDDDNGLKLFDNLDSVIVK